MEQGLAELRATGASLWQPYFLALLAEAYGRTSRAGEGLDLLEEAAVIMNRQEECFLAPELHRLRGGLLLRRGEEAEAEACFARALELARPRQGRTLELRASLSPARLWAGRGHARRAKALLEPMMEALTEGGHVPDLARARRLLASLP